MASPEKPRMEVTESMSAAERRVNVNKEDIPREQKLQIATLERSIRDFMRDPKYAELKDSYKRDLGNYDNSPESVLGTVKYHFDKMQAAENEASAEALRSISFLAISKLEEVKHDLGIVSQIQEDHDRSYAAAVGRMTGADRPIAEAQELPENMDAIEEMLGIKPRQKLETNAVLNEEKLVELKRPENSVAYMNAKVMYASITGGAHLEDATKMIDDALTEGIAKAKSLTDQQARQSALLKLVEHQLKGMQGLYKILTAKDREEPPHHAAESKESSEFTDEQMAEILDKIMAEVRWDRVDASKPVKVPTTISEGLDAYYNVGQAYQFYTGRGPQDLNFVEASHLGMAQGALDALVGFDKMAVGAVSWVGEKTGLVSSEHKSEATAHAEGAVSKILSTCKSLLDPNTWTMGWQMLQYGFENTTSNEKVFMLNKIVTELITGGAIGGEVLHALKLGKYVVGGKAALELMGGAFEAVSTLYPSLAKYGFTAEKIVTGLEGAAHKVVHLWDHGVLHSAHLAEKAHGVEAAVYHPTVGAYSHAKEEVIHEEHSFEYDEMKEVAQDIRQALKGADSLGLTEDQVADLRHERAQIESRIATVSHG